MTRAAKQPNTQTAMAGTTHGPLITAPQALNTTTPTAAPKSTVSRSASQRNARAFIHARRTGRAAPQPRHTCQPRPLVRWHARHIQVAPGAAAVAAVRPLACR